MAGTLDEGVLYGLDGRVHRVQGGVVADGGQTLPMRWRVGDGYANEARGGGLTQEAALLGSRLAWAGDGGVWLMDLDTGSSSLLAAEPRAIAVALGSHFEAWRTESELTIRSDAGSVSRAVTPGRPAMVVSGSWVIWAEGATSFARHLDGREVHFQLPRAVVGLASEGCGVWVLLTPPVAGATDWVYRFSPGP